MTLTRFHGAAASALVIVLVSSGCSGFGEPPVPPVTVTQTVPPPSSPAPSASAASTTAAPSTAPSPVTIDTLPPGYPYLVLKKVARVGNRWTLTVDPVTLCQRGSTEPACVEALRQSGGEYEVLNQSTRTYTVELSPQARIRRIVDGQPDTYRDSAPESTTWSATEQVIAQVQQDSRDVVTTVTEWWHP